MKTYSATININAAPQTIWALLTDAPSWADWNPTVDKVEGTIALDEQIAVHAKVSPGRPFELKVSEFVPAQRMVWSSGMPLGLFKGERTFSLQPNTDGTVEFATREVFSGLLSPLITRFIPNLQPSFDEFVAALKATAEGT